MKVDVQSSFCNLLIRFHREIMNIQEQVAEIQSLLKLHGDQLKRTRACIGIIHQLHTTPKHYMVAVSEVVRRRAYSQAFLMVSILTHQLLSVLKT